MVNVWVDRLASSDPDEKEIADITETEQRHSFLDDI